MRKFLVLILLSSCSEKTVQVNVKESCVDLVVIDSKVCHLREKSYLCNNGSDLNSYILRTGDEELNTKPLK